jgi:hypothetical protein
MQIVGTNDFFCKFKLFYLISNADVADRDFVFEFPELLLAAHDLLLRLVQLRLKVDGVQQQFVVLTF